MQCILRPSTMNHTRKYKPMIHDPVFSTPSGRDENLQRCNRNPYSRGQVGCLTGHEGDATPFNGTPYTLRPPNPTPSEPKILHPATSKSFTLQSPNPTPVNPQILHT